jgi:hypothetical protein
MMIFEGELIHPVELPILENLIKSVSMWQSPANYTEIVYAATAFEIV